MSQWWLPNSIGGSLHPLFYFSILSQSRLLFSILSILLLFFFYFLKFFWTCPFHSSLPATVFPPFLPHSHLFRIPPLPVAPSSSASTTHTINIFSIFSSSLFLLLYVFGLHLSLLFTSLCFTLSTSNSPQELLLPPLIIQPSRYTLVAMDPRGVYMPTWPDLLWPLWEGRDIGGCTQGCTLVMEWLGSTSQLCSCIVRHFREKQEGRQALEAVQGRLLTGYGMVRRCFIVRVFVV